MAIDKELNTQQKKVGGEKEKGRVKGNIFSQFSCECYNKDFSHILCEWQHDI